MFTQFLEKFKLQSLTSLLTCIVSNIWFLFVIKKDLKNSAKDSRLKI